MRYLRVPFAGRWRLPAAFCLALISAGAMASAAQAYTLTADEARFIAVSESDGNYKFRGVQSWGAWADDQATGYTETSFQRVEDAVVTIHATRQWFGCDHGPCGEPNAFYSININEDPTSPTHSYYYVCVNSGAGDSYWPLSSATSCFTRG